MCVVSSALLDAILYEERHDPLFGLLSEACLPLAIILSSTDSHLAISCHEQATGISLRARKYENPFPWAALSGSVVVNENTVSHH